MKFNAIDFHAGLLGVLVLGPRLRSDSSLRSVDILLTHRGPLDSVVVTWRLGLRYLPPRGYMLHWINVHDLFVGHCLSTTYLDEQASSVTEHLVA